MANFKQADEGVNLDVQKMPNNRSVVGFFLASAARRLAFIAHLEVFGLNKNFTNWSRDEELFKERFKTHLQCLYN